MFRPWLQDASPDLRYCTMQPVELGVEAGFQYRPSEWNVATAEPPAGSEAELFCTLTLTCELAERPCASYAVALTTCVPFARVFVSSVPLYGAAVLLASSVPSAKKSTLVTPAASVA